jgi:hypothetical protein
MSFVGFTKESSSKLDANEESRELMAISTNKRTIISMSSSEIMDSGGAGDRFRSMSAFLDRHTSREGALVQRLYTTA